MALVASEANATRKKLCFFRGQPEDGQSLALVGLRLGPSGWLPSECEGNLAEIVLHCPTRSEATTAATKDCATKNLSIKTINHKRRGEYDTTVSADIYSA